MEPLILLYNVLFQYSLYSRDNQTFSGIMIVYKAGIPNFFLVIILFIDLLHMPSVF